MLQMLQVTAAASSWERLRLAAFSCVARQLSDTIGRSAAI